MMPIDVKPKPKKKSIIRDVGRNDDPILPGPANPILPIQGRQATQRKDFSDARNDDPILPRQEPTSNKPGSLTEPKRYLGVKKKQRLM